MGGAHVEGAFDEREGLDLLDLQIDVPDAKFVIPSREKASRRGGSRMLFLLGNIQDENRKEIPRKQSRTRNAVSLQPLLRVFPSFRIS